MSFFQSQIYYDLLNGVPGVEPFLYKEIEEDGSTSGQFIGAFIQSGNRITRRFTSRILLIDGPHVFSPNVERITGDLFRQLIDIDKQFKNCIYTEIRFLQYRPVLFDFSVIPHCEYNPYLNIIVDTSKSEEQLFQNLSESKKRQVKMSLKAGALIKCATTEEEVKTFYNILLNLYRKKVRKPLYPLEFFLRFLHQKEAGVILLAYYQDKIIGGMLCPIFEKKEMYEWYIAGLDLELQKKMIYPSVLLTWEALKFASLNKIQKFNFMGAGKPDTAYGVRDFKLTFGGELVETPRYVIAHKPLLYAVGKFVMALGVGTFLNSEQ
jgi:serine/alanine adding enzyme